MKKNLKRYNIAVNILFWTLVLLISGSAIFLVSGGIDHLKELLVEGEETVIIEEKPIVVNVKEVERIEEEVDWFYFVATGYSGNDPSQGTTSTTATGERVREGIIAVDPSVIPFGTEIEIKDMGVFSAEDCGGNIKGNRIDIYFDSKSDAKAFGRQGIWIRIMDDNQGQVKLAEIFE